MRDDDPTMETTLAGPETIVVTMLKSCELYTAYLP